MTLMAVSRQNKECTILLVPEGSRYYPTGSTVATTKTGMLVRLGSDHTPHPHIQCFGVNGNEYYFDPSVEVSIIRTTEELAKEYLQTHSEYH